MLRRRATRTLFVSTSKLPLALHLTADESDTRNHGYIIKMVTAVDSKHLKDINI